jgi:cytochrome oxidase assembly protein ShyY1
VFRALVWTLRQRRYAALAAAGLVLALICGALGTFEIHRYEDKRHDNGALRANAHAAPVALTTSLVPVDGRGNAPGQIAIRYRRVTVSGTYLTRAQQYLTDQTQGGRQGFYVLTPLRTATATLLVLRGFVAAAADETRPAVVAPTPRGTVRVAGWLQPPQTSHDQLGRLGHQEITSINVSEQAARLHAPVYQASLTLTARQPGTAGLRAVPLPGLSNPSGGAAEWQLLSYVVQWYAFAVLALLLPFFVSRSEVRDARRRFLGIDVGAAQFDALDRPFAPVGGGAGGELVARERGELARRAQVALRVDRAERLADRYGRSLGIDPEQALAAQHAEAAPDTVHPAVRDSTAAPHRSADGYHASYNDYLWQLALADGGMPDVFGKDEPQLIEAVAESDDDAQPGGEAPVS